PENAPGSGAGAKADKPERYEPPRRLQHWGAPCEFLCSLGGRRQSAPCASATRRACWLGASRRCGSERIAHAGAERVMNLTLIDAFGRFGAKPDSRLGSLSAMAADGAMVLNCLPAHFGHPTRGVLRYETRLSTAQAESKVVTALGVHLTRAREESLPVRMVVTYAEREKTS